MSDFPASIQGLAFQLDGRACSGCKACQVACKDRNHLKTGQLWRHIVTISGGTWQQTGAAWTSDAFSYNLSLACNHCDKPICLEVCPAAAISQRPDGIVLIDTDRCLGCQFCSWACPYSAPQFDSQAGVMTKCNFCVHDVDQGRQPACVAACPLRVLDVIARPEPGSSAAIFPLPNPDWTRPALQIQPHPHTTRAGKTSTQVYERVTTSQKFYEPALVAYTLLLQTAVGAFGTLGILFRLAQDRAGMQEARLMSIVPAGLIALLVFLGIGASLFHLGHPERSYRALANLRQSWLSREILLTLLFAGSSSILAIVEILQIANTTVRDSLWAITVLLGGTLVYAMVRIYRLRTVPIWNRTITTAAFFSTSLLLGSTITGLAITANEWLLTSYFGKLPFQALLTHMAWRQIAPWAIVFAGSNWLSSWLLTRKTPDAQNLHWLQLGLTITMIGLACFLLTPASEGTIMKIAALLMFSLETILCISQRFLFYRLGLTQTLVDRSQYSKT
jgi:anaerobic dimethyl sulfoxide reductase subunit B